MSEQFTKSGAAKPPAIQTPRKADEFLNQHELSKRWKLSPRTLERWRWLGTGPRYHKIGGRVVYRLSDIEEFENGRSFTSTMDEQHGGAQ